MNHRRRRWQVWLGPTTKRSELPTSAGGGARAYREEDLRQSAPRFGRRGCAHSKVSPAGAGQERRRKTGPRPGPRTRSRCRVVNFFFCPSSSSSTHSRMPPLRASRSRGHGSRRPPFARGFSVPPPGHGRPPAGQALYGEGHHDEESPRWVCNAAWLNEVGGRVRRKNLPPGGPGMRKAGQPRRQ